MILRCCSGEPAVSLLYELVEVLGADVEEFSESQARVAVSAFARFGKGMGHRARLNFGDCAAYALAALRGEPVLATGNDFAATDLAVIQL